MQIDICTAFNQQFGGNVKVIGTIAVLVASAALSAQEGSRGLDFRIQVGAEMTRPNQSVLFTDSVNNINYKVQPDEQFSLQAKILGELPGAPGFYYQLGGRLESKSKLTFNQAVNGIRLDTREVEVSYSYFSFGGAYLWNLPTGLSIGAHLEGRIERMGTSGYIYSDDDRYDLVDTSATYLRAWGSLSLDYTFNNAGRVRPFIGIEGAYPITKREQKSNWALGLVQTSNLVESLAPEGSVACYFGFRL